MFRCLVAILSKNLSVRPSVCRLIMPHVKSHVTALYDHGQRLNLILWSEKIVMGMTPRAARSGLFRFLLKERQEKSREVNVLRITFLSVCVWLVRGFEKKTSIATIRTVTYVFEKKTFIATIRTVVQRINLLKFSPYRGRNIALILSLLEEAT